MNKLIIIILILWLPFVSLAQLKLTNNGAKLRIETSSHLKIEGNLTNQNNGTITNNGNLFIQGDFIQVGAGSTYSGTGTLCFEGGNGQIVSDSPITLVQLVVNDGQELILGSDLTVSTTVNLSNDGTIKLDDYDLIIGNSGTITGVDESNFIITDGTGNLVRQVGSSAVVFPIGNDSYNPITLTNAGTIDNFSVRVENQLLSAYPSGDIENSGVVKRAWRVEEETVGGSDVNMTVQWDESEEAGSFDRTNSGISHWTGSVWDRPAVFNSATNVSGTIWTQERSNITSFSPFGVEDSNESLPITLLDFQAKRLNTTQVQLDWITTSEINNRGFEIEFSQNAVDFEKVSFVDGAGNSNNTLNYQLLVDNSEVGYYRLKQIDFDGKFSYSPVRFVESGNGEVILRIFPNPNLGKLTFDLGSYQDNASLVVFNTKGEAILKITDNIENINAVINQKIKFWSNGTYIFRVQAGRKLFAQKLILRR